MINDSVKTYFEKNGIILPKKYTIDTSFSTFLWRIEAHGIILSLSPHTRRLYLYPHYFTKENIYVANKEIIQIWNDKIIKLETLDKLKEKL